MISQTNFVKDDNLLLVHADGVSKTISFVDANIVKTDENFNATCYGYFSGKNLYLTSISSLDTVSSLIFQASGFNGISPTVKYVNLLTLKSGLITSGVSAIGTPEYNTITTSLTALTAYQNGLYKFIVDESSASPLQDQINILQNTTSRYYAVSGFFQRNPKVTAGELRPYHFNLMPVGNALSSQPFVNNIDVDHRGNLTFYANAGYPVKYDTPLHWRLFYTEKYS